MPKDLLFIWDQKLAVMAQNLARMDCWSTAWSTDQRSNFWPLESGGDRSTDHRPKLCNRSTL